MTTEQQIQEYCDQNNISLSDRQTSLAVNLVDNEGYQIDEAVDEVNEENPTSPDPDKPA